MPVTTPEHSPGPWSLEDRDDCSGYALRDADGDLIDYISDTRYIDDRVDHQQVANARLIASAFDLLEELEQQADGTSTIISLLGGQTGPVAASLIGMLRIQEQAARATIAKARGDAQ